MSMSITPSDQIENRTPSQRLRDVIDAVDVKNNEDVPTATALCERAGISRNALYRYHRDILSELHKLQEYSRRQISNLPQQRLQQLSDENRALKHDIAELASLVDHYFSAWQECNSALQRRDRELVELRSKTKHRVVSL
jgi:AcrR family transcriptional regulator